MIKYEFKFDVKDKVVIENGMYAGRTGYVTHIEISESGVSYRVWIPYGSDVNDGYVSHYIEDDLG